MKKYLVWLVLSICLVPLLPNSSFAAIHAPTLDANRISINYNLDRTQSDGAFHDGLLLAEQTNGALVYYNAKGTVAFHLPPALRPVSDYSSQRAIVQDKLTKLYGYVNTKGVMVTPLQYEEVTSFAEGVAHVRRADSHIEYLIDRGGNILLQLTTRYDSDFHFSNGLSLVTDTKTGHIGYINKNGHLTIPYSYKYGRDFAEQLALVQNKTGQYGFINTKGKVTIPLQYKAAQDFQEGVAAVQNKAGQWGFIDNRGQVFLPFHWSRVDSFSEGLAAVYNRKGQVAFINKKGALVIPYQKYNKASPFKQGLALVGIGDNTNGKFGYINQKGRLVTALQYRSESSSFSAEGLAVAILSPGKALILSK
ncbi:hypothetical protein J2Z69_003476 [Paenibacillus shirakamiensis]|uniref:WG repeat-containing protein n=1 Tax=Paenibacillus shirakamiensis TaxID=1265935 RepID=A0ABS4JL17_9BACL|nr:WG repeat-containing protein [Paenibacillus shirakamiensis]MBP2002403.1 hypothetical protein [Paenibacillus shirakamiensis]